MGNVTPRVQSKMMQIFLLSCEVLKYFTLVMYLSNILICTANVVQNGTWECGYIITKSRNPEKGTPILGYGHSEVISPRFLVVHPRGSLFYASDLIDPLFLQKKIGLSLSHLVPEILWAKFGLISPKCII